MRLKDIETFVVNNPPPSFGGRYFLFVKLVTDNGIIGYGEMYASSVGPGAQVLVTEDLFERYCIGESPHAIEKLFRKFHSSGFSQRPDPTIMGSFSAIEMACWDIVGKALDKPIYDLIGGRVNSRIRSYSYLYPDDLDDPESFYHDPYLSAESAARYVKEGFTAIKFDPAGPYTIYDPRQPSIIDIERSAKFCHLIREAVGSKADLLFGTHGQFTSSGAIRIAQRFAEYQPLWFEEPVPPEMPEEMSKVASQSTIPIATGERLSTKYEFARILRLGAASILQPALGRVGGIWESKKIAALAEVHYAQIAPHLYCGPLQALANIQYSASIPNFLILESIGKFEGFHAQLLNHPIVWEDGYVLLSDRPGLGHELNEDVARSHPYHGSNLHLEMQDMPYDSSFSSI
ncbi:mandelate racemase/muconate lactonizing enzyme family protein [Candidatus Endowatersipora endosymbiont of Watersipora subatra]|uniref:mandelate racemase/muconate lactonizing enzyme family protein n=1 Tax=Candidatus Endowatersipora endosymbiont of Watersipora subatra TaxID=3077946 RepID=UPI00312C799D